MASNPKDLGLFGKFNILCIRLLLWCESRIAALFVLMIVGLIVGGILSAIYGDDRACLRRGPATYVQTGTTMTPIPGPCLEYEE